LGFWVLRFWGFGCGSVMVCGFWSFGILGFSGRVEGLGFGVQGLGFRV
jgi:hypothetical protein